MEIENAIFLPNSLFETISVEDIPSWLEFAEAERFQILEEEKGLAGCICLWFGDLAKIKIQCIVNSANQTLLRHGGLSEVLHRVAGPQLEQECMEKFPSGMKIAECGLTSAYNLPSDFVLHAVGPTQNNAEDLERTYYNALQTAYENDIRFIAFPNIATGSHMWTVESAAEIVIPTVCNQIRSLGSFEKVIFVCHCEDDLNVYKRYLKRYFNANEDIEDTLSLLDQI